MENRTKIAFLLIALVLGTNLVLMERVGPKRPRRSDVADSAAARTETAGLKPIPVPSPGAGTPASAASSATTTFPDASRSDTEIIVYTPLYEVHIATAGGVITSLRLPGFDLGKDGAVDLIAADTGLSGRTALGVHLATVAGDLDLTRARFDVVTPLQEPGVMRVAAGSEPQRLTLRSAAAAGGAILEHFVFDPARYVIGFELELERGAGIPEVSALTVQWTRGLATTEGNQKDDWAAFKVAARVDGEVHRHGLGGMLGGGSGEKENSYSGNVDWVNAQSKYFTVVLIPKSQEGGTLRLRTDARAHWLGFDLTHPLAWKRGPLEVYDIYAGPIDVDLLAENGRGLEAIVDLGWAFVRPISKIVLAGMNWLYGFIPNYGAVILILSTVTQLMFWPLSQKSFSSMRKMQNLQPMVQELKRRYKDSPQEMNQQMMALWRKEGVNPMGGCMPMLVQVPVLFALYSALRSTIDLRGAPFVLWMDNLAAPDVLFQLPFSIPGLGPAISVLPILMGAAMVWRSAISPAMPGMTGAAAQQQIIMKWIMPIVMTFIFYKMPSGLVLYWLVNSVLGVWQQVLINRKFGPVPVPPALTTPAKHGGNDDAAASRSDGQQPRRGAGKGADRVGGKAR